MPAGLQVWDALGALVIDTSYAVLREIVITTVSDSNTNLNTISVNAPAEANVVAAGHIVSGVTGEAPEVAYNSGTGNLEYQWANSGLSRTAALQVLLF